FRRVLAGNHVGLDAERGNKDVVNHIFRSHDQFDLAADGDVQFINLALAGRMLKLPHPQFADDVNFQGILCGSILCKIDLSAPQEDRRRDAQRDYRPQCFKLDRAFDGARNFKLVATPITNDKENYETGNQQCEEKCDARQIEIQSINIARQSRSAFRYEWKPGLHLLIISVQSSKL